MAVTVDSYRIMFYGGAYGYQRYRAQIGLRDSSNKVVAYVRFMADGTPFGTDREKNGTVIMHLPESALAGVIDMLRNEKPIYVYFAANHGFLTTTKEPVGEGEG